MDQSSSTRTYHVRGNRVGLIALCVLGPCLLVQVAFHFLHSDSKTSPSLGTWLGAGLIVVLTIVLELIVRYGDQYETTDDCFCNVKSVFGLVTIARKCYDWNDVFVIAHSEIGLLIDVNGQMHNISPRFDGYDELLSAVIARSATKTDLPPMTIPTDSLAHGLDSKLVDKVRVGLKRGVRLPVIAMLKQDLGVSLKEADQIVKEIARMSHRS